MLTVTVERVETGYKILPSDHVAKDLQETEHFVQTNFQVVPNEWAKMKSDLDRTGKTSIERSLGKFSQGA
jgi:hypothetical protein